MTLPGKPSAHADPLRPIHPRREFLRDTTLGVAGVAVGAQFPSVLTGRAAPDDVIRIGLIGCGGRGTGAVLDALGAATEVVYPTSGYHTEDVAKDARIAARNVQVVTLADLFPDRLRSCRVQLSKLGLTVKDDLCFTGFDAYQKVMALPEVNYVLLATPPFFRPAHLRAAVEAGKHAFLEKPVAVDATGVRSIIESGELAQRKGLTIGAGTMRRRENGSRETIKRIRDGAIGEVIACEAIWSGANCGRWIGSRAGATWRTSCATGCTTPGCQGISSSSSLCTTST